MIIKRIFIFLVVSICSSSVTAHQDRLISLDDGKLVGIPSKYQPALLDLSIAKLTLSGKSVIFPECIKAILDLGDYENINISSSWYHEKSLLPPYIVFRNKQLKTALLLNMTTLEPIEIFNFSDQKNKFESCSSELTKNIQ